MSEQPFNESPEVKKAREELEHEGEMDKIKREIHGEPEPELPEPETNPDHGPVHDWTDKEKAA